MPLGKLGWSGGFANTVETRSSSAVAVCLSGGNSRVFPYAPRSLYVCLLTLSHSVQPVTFSPRSLASTPLFCCCRTPCLLQLCDKQQCLRRRFCLYCIFMLGKAAQYSKCLLSQPRGRRNFSSGKGYSVVAPSTIQADSSWNSKAQNPRYGMTHPHVLTLCLNWYTVVTKAAVLCSLAWN